MSKYTVLDDTNADKIIEKELSIITSELTDLFGDYIKAILITGGYGRGEGAVVNDNGSYKPINDYDIIVIVKKHSSIPLNLRERLPELVTRLNSQLNVKQIDLAFIDAWKLTIPYPSIARYEIKKGNKLLFGKLPYSIRCFPAKLIPLYEGTTYFRTRGAGLLLARLLLDGYGQLTEKERLKFAFLEINKALLVLGDVCLIKNAKYNYSYVTRKTLAKEINNIFLIPDEILKLYLHGLKNKLTPSLKNLNYDQLNSQWIHISSKFINSFLKYESERCGKVFKRLIEYYRYVDENIINKKSVLNKIKSLWNKEDNRETSRQRLAVMFLLDYQLCNNSKYFDIINRLQTLPHNQTHNWLNFTLEFFERWPSENLIKRMQNGYSSQSC